MEEIWKDIEGYEGYYQVSNLGRVKSLRTKKNLTPVSDNYGYQIVCLHSRSGTQKNHKIHRLVSFAFIPTDKKRPEVNHKNGIKTDNRVENLEWCSSSENKLHAFKLCLRNNKGENGSHKLKNEDVFFIKYESKNIKASELAKQFKVSNATISLIRKGINWPHI